MIDNRNHPGLFITFEGGDGSGKTTQADLLADRLQQLGRRIVQTREPGGTDVGTQLRNIVLHHKGHIDPRAEALMYAADRAHHIATVVRPALKSGAVVLQDRFVDSSLAYQGAGRLLDLHEIRGLSTWATRGLVPDVTILLDLDEDAARSRLNAARNTFDRLEGETTAFHRRVRRNYLDLAEAEPERITLVDATCSIEDIAHTIYERVSAHL